MSSATKHTESAVTQPALRARLKKKIQAGSKGGRAGQWSARKAQMLAQAYRQAGGGYRGGRSAGAKHLTAWTKEQWKTSDGGPARRRSGTTRYLPAAAWKKLTPGERRATNARKKAGSRKGRQFVANTAKAKRARKSSAAKS